MKRHKEQFRKYVLKIEVEVSKYIIMKKKKLFTKKKYLSKFENCVKFGETGLN